MYSSLPASIASRISHIVPRLFPFSSKPFVRNMSDTVAAPVCSGDSCAVPSKISHSDQASAHPVSSSTKPVITIDIISDNVCPWCFVGKRRLEKAIEKVPKDAAEFHIRWHPYQLEPDAPAESVPKIDRFRQKFGGNVERMLQNMIEVGRGVGINFQYTNNGRIGNTLNSHRLVEFAFQKGGEVLQNKMINVLFNAYFELERDIADKQVLIDLAVRAGLDKQETEELLQSDRYEKEIQQYLFSNFQNNITGVPHFTFNNKYQISGGQEPAVFLSIFKRLGVKL